MINKELIEWIRTFLNRNADLLNAGDTTSILNKCSENYKIQVAFTLSQSGVKSYFDIVKDYALKNELSAEELCELDDFTVYYVSSIQGDICAIVEKDYTCEIFDPGSYYIGFRNDYGDSITWSREDEEEATLEALKKSNSLNEFNDLLYEYYEEYARQI